MPHSLPAPEPAPVPGAPGCAFFDVDETLIIGKSMTGFLGFHLARLPRAQAQPLRAQAQDLVRAAALGPAGPPRAELNRAYYRLFRGCGHEELERTGRAWFHARLAGGDLFHPAVARALDGHRARGRTIVLVSGSFAPCLDPIARHVGADLVICTRPHRLDGVLTGEVDAPMIGRRKALAARSTLTRLSASRSESYAYGDDASDLPLLRTVGHPVVVGEDRLLRGWAEARGWARLPGARRGAARPPIRR